MAAACRTPESPKPIPVSSVGVSVGVVTRSSQRSPRSPRGPGSPYRFRLANVSTNRHMYIRHAGHDTRHAPRAGSASLDHLCATDGAQVVRHWSRPRSHRRPVAAEGPTNSRSSVSPCRNGDRIRIAGLIEYGQVRSPLRRRAASPYRLALTGCGADGVGVGVSRTWGGGVVSVAAAGPLLLPPPPQPASASDRARAPAESAQSFVCDVISTRLPSCSIMERPLD